VTAQVTQAERQAAEYRAFLIRRFEDSSRYFPAFDEPDCLVVIGCEDSLNQQQRVVLRDANNSRKRLRIVGFDWLMRRSRAVLHNLIEGAVEVSKLRMI
jgi:hypothetical protein